MSSLIVFLGAAALLIILLLSLLRHRNFSQRHPTMPCQIERC